MGIDEARGDPTPGGIHRPGSVRVDVAYADDPTRRNRDIALTRRPTRAVDEKTPANDKFGVHQFILSRRESQVKSVPPFFGHAARRSARTRSLP
jgi:hypothetical protein